MKSGDVGVESAPANAVAQSVYSHVYVETLLHLVRQ